MNQRFLFGSGSHSASVDTGLLVVRLFAGLAMAFGHGLGKFPPSEKFIEGVGGLGFPAPVLFAWAAALSEFLGGLLITIGLLTRPAAVSLALTMATAAFLRHASDPFAAKEKALLYLVIAVLLVITGAGRYSIDRLVRRGR